jgi:hypothetical protein
MLTENDTPTVRFALIRRLDKEPGVEICDLKFEKYRIGDSYRDLDNGGIERIAAVPFMRVGLLATLGGTLITRSVFDLPIPFSLQHVHDQVDEIAEQFKAARKDAFGRGAGMILTAEKQLAGTGLRGRWAMYG